MSRLRFRRREHEQPQLNTSSLPDLIFTVLFFFMIVTHMRNHEPLLHYQVPKGTELQQQKHKSSVVYIYIGPRIGSVDGEPLIQLNSRLCTLSDIAPLISEARAAMSEEDRMRMTVNIKADSDTPLGLISDVKRELQRAGALRVTYAASEQPGE